MLTLGQESDRPYYPMFSKPGHPASLIPAQTGTPERPCGTRQSPDSNGPASHHISSGHAPPAIPHLHQVPLLRLLGLTSSFTVFIKALVLDSFIMASLSSTASNPASPGSRHTPPTAGCPDPSHALLSGASCILGGSSSSASSGNRVPSTSLLQFLSRRRRFHTCELKRLHANRDNEYSAASYLSSFTPSRTYSNSFPSVSVSLGGQKSGVAVIFPFSSIVDRK